jgi:hypothetical protein
MGNRYSIIETRLIYIYVYVYVYVCVCVFHKAECLMINSSRILPHRVNSVLQNRFLHAALTVEI